MNIIWFKKKISRFYTKLILNNFKRVLYNSQYFILEIFKRSYCEYIKKRGLKKLKIKVDIYDPHAIKKEVLKNFKIKLLDNIKSKYDIIILAVAHKKFLKMNLVNFKTINGIIYDVKSVLDENIISGRL